MKDNESQQRAPGFSKQWLLVLLGFFCLALIPRVHGSIYFGKDLDGPGTFRVINFDENGSCRSVISDFSYPEFIGYQVIALAETVGYPAPEPGDDRVGRQYCHSRPLILVHRIYSAVLGSLTVVLLGLIALLLVPAQPRIAWIACTLLALSNFHIAESHSGTVDAAQVFFIYLLSLALLYGRVKEKRWPIIVSPLLLIAAVWTKWFVFAVFAYACFLPYLNLDRHYKKLIVIAIIGGILGLASLTLVDWAAINPTFRRLSAFFWGPPTSKFGSGYAQIGGLRRWIRNATNIPIVHIVGIGLPACVFAVAGIRQVIADKVRRQDWLIFGSIFAYALYMLLLAPVTYYRYYLPFFPLVALLAAIGFGKSKWSLNRGYLALFLIWPALLGIDSEYNYRFDPRRELRPWYQERLDPRTLVTFYTVPPAWVGKTGLFNLDVYLKHGEGLLQTAGYVVLSENWYDTSFPNELNGPIAWKPEWLIKTKPEYVRAYRNILAGKDDNLVLDDEFNLFHFTPEFLIHRYFYGSFQLFIGDLKVFKVVGRER